MRESREQRGGGGGGGVQKGARLRPSGGTVASTKNKKTRTVFKDERGHIIPPGVSVISRYKPLVYTPGGVICPISAHKVQDLTEATTIHTAR